MENLLNPDRQGGPWLSCPKDKSGQLRVELQLERAVPIGYIDVGEWVLCGLETSAEHNDHIPLQMLHQHVSVQSDWSAFVE